MIRWLGLWAISIHSLRVEGDMPAGMMTGSASYFNPLPPCGGRPAGGRERGGGRRNFNPLPPCGGRLLQSCREGINNNFNPLPPCGGRQSPADVIPVGLLFQSTPSVWRETAKLHSFPLKTQQSKCNFDKKEHRYTSPCQKKYFFSDFFTKKRVRISPAFFVRLGFAPERFLRTKAVPPHRWFPLRRYVPLSSDTDSPDSRTGGYLSRYRWHPSAAV